MKKKLIIVFIIALLLVFTIYGVNAAASDNWWTNKQVVAHNIAEEARSLGLSEDDPIITRAQELWWEDYPPASYQPAPTKTYLGTYYITGYDICYSCCGKVDGITASGTKATVGRTIAAPSNLPFGTRLYIDGIGERVVEDRGGSVSGNRLDLLCNNHSECYAITGYYDVYIIN